MPGHLGLIVKATRLCNLRCAYCHDWRTGAGQTMSFEIMARMTASALRDSGADEVDFIWHGGEPTVLRTSFYEKALYVQAQFQRPGQQVRNSLQTNGTLLTDDWLRLFQDNRFAVSVSLDGPPLLHGAYRPWASGRSSFTDTLAGIRQLREAEIPFGILMVVDEGTLALGPDRLFEFFLEMGIRDVGLLAAAPENQPDARPGAPPRHFVDAARMTTFLARVYDRWLEHGDPGLRIRELDALRRRLDGRPPAVCLLAGECIGRYFSVEPNGDVAHCDLYVGDPDYTFGNLQAGGFHDFDRHPRFLAFREDNARALDRMRACPEFAVCNGWCPHERYLAERHQKDHAADCCGLRGLIAHMRARQARTAEPAAEATASP